MSSLRSQKAKNAMDRPKGQSGPGFGIPGKGGALRHCLRGAGLAAPTACGGGRFQMYWPSRVQRLMRSRRETRKVSLRSLASDQVATETREDGEAPGARTRTGQQGAAEEGSTVRAARCPLRARGKASQVGKCGPEPRGAATPGNFNSLCPR